MQCEFILNNKKELTIKENKLFENIKMCNINDWYSQDVSRDELLELLAEMDKLKI